MTSDKSMAERLIKKWLELDFWPATREEASNLLTNEFYPKIERDFNSQDRIKLNNYGIQGKYGPGFTKINELVIAQTAQSVYYYCLRVVGEAELKMHGVGIGYDQSPHAKDFANISAAIFVLHGVRVYMTSGPVSVSYTEYLNRYYMCGCGFMATETHIPQTECRYIIYGIGCGSFLSPQDMKHITELISEDNSHIFNPHPELEFLDKVLQQGIESRLLIMLDQEHEVSKAYYRELKSLKYFNREYRKNMKTSFKIGCFLIGAHDMSAIIHILKTVFLFSEDAIKSRFIFFDDADFNALPLEQCITVACERSNTINLQIKTDANRQPPIKIVICTDTNAEAIWMAELKNSGCYPSEWNVYGGEEIETFIINWCIRNLISNPLVLENIERCRKNNYYNIHSCLHTVQTNTTYPRVVLYNSIAHRGTISYKKVDSDCGAACAHYQGVNQTNNEILIAKDGAIMLGIMSELLIDIYEFFGSSVNIQRKNSAKHDSCSFNGCITMFERI